MCLEYVHVCVYLCVFITFPFLHVIKWGSIVQVSTSWTSLTRGASSYTSCVGMHMSVENICVFMCTCLRALDVCALCILNVITLLLMQSQF